MQVSVYITPPANVNSYYRAVYAGFIIVNDTYKIYNIPYAGQQWSIGEGLIDTEVAISSFSN